MAKILNFREALELYPLLIDTGDKELPHNEFMALQFQDITPENLEKFINIFDCKRDNLWVELSTSLHANRVQEMRIILHKMLER